MNYDQLFYGFQNNLEVTSQGMEPPRCYYIPFDQHPEGKQREESGEFQLLDGQWDFRRFDSPLEAEGFPEKEYTESIPVPSCVQYYGYDEPQYSGGRTTFPFTPPYVPRENPIFCYRRRFSSEKRGGRRQYIVFEGVDSCFWLFLNGKYVGYSEISHADHEFDVTDFLRDGENVVDVAVAKWCKGSYLELQDKWRFSGIFGSVYLLNRPEKHITDYKISSVRSGEDRWAMRIEYLRGNVEMRAGAAGQTVTLRPGESAEIPVADPKLWTAETPHTYPVEISGGGEYIGERIALREITVQNRVVCLNGKPVKFRGANRHDFHPRRGAAVSQEDMLRDIRLMKQYNFNAVRTSHYPNRAEFYRMCDEYGLYVICEADIECHGAVLIEGGYEEEFFKLLSDNPQWQAQYLARIQTMYERDKNRGCILFWSLGNESGYGCNHEASARWLKARDSRLIHYEGIQCRRDHKTEVNEDIYYTSLLDVVSRMYPSIAYMREKCLEDPREHRPLLLCEYAHSMGNSPGGLQDYWDLINSDDRIAGAFVWEWADHGIDIGDGRYRYGSDFQVAFSDGNYCIDGCIGPNRESKSAIRALKAAMQPIDVEKESGDSYLLRNRYDFLPAEGLEITAVFKKNGEVLAAVPVSSGDLPARGEKRISLPFPGEIGEADFANVIFESRTKEASPLVEAGHLTARTGFVIHEPPHTAGSLISHCVFRESGRKLTVESGEYAYTFDRFTGTLETVGCGGLAMKVDLQPQILRATLDNDAANKVTWNRYGLYDAKPTAWKERFDEETGTLTFEGAFAGQIYRPVVHYRMTYRFSGGTVELKLEGRISECVEFLPRFGLRLCLPRSYGNYDYLAYGEDESYVDKRMQTCKDLYSANVEKDFIRYIKPQESTSHWGAHWLTVRSEEGRLAVTADRDFSFSAVPYTVEELMSAGHDYELPAPEKCVVSLDYGMSGVGLESCGPHLDPKYQMKEKAPEITFRLCFSDQRDS